MRFLHDRSGPISRLSVRTLTRPITHTVASPIVPTPEPSYADVSGFDEVFTEWIRWEGFDEIIAVSIGSGFIGALGVEIYIEIQDNLNQLPILTLLEDNPWYAEIRPGSMVRFYAISSSTISIPVDIYSLAVGSPIPTRIGRQFFMTISVPV